MFQYITFNMKHPVEKVVRSIPASSIMSGGDPGEAVGDVGTRELDEGGATSDFVFGIRRESLTMSGDGVFNMAVDDAELDAKAATLTLNFDFESGVL